MNASLILQASKTALPMLVTCGPRFSDASASRSGSGLLRPKTLAKCANDVAKKNPIFAGVLDMMDETLADFILPMVPVGDIWGVGRQTRKKLAAVGIHTAADLRDMPLRQARSVGTVVLERTVLELQGEACLSFDEVEPQRKGMAVTRSAGRPMTDFETLFQAITSHATRAAEKLRRHGLVRRNAYSLFPHKPPPAGQATILRISINAVDANVCGYLRSGQRSSAVYASGLAERASWDIRFYEGRRTA